MKRNIFFLPLICTIVLFSSCAKDSKIKQENFDMKTWKNDPFACKGDREKLEDDFLSVKDRLLGTSITDIRQILGKPDRVDLDTRSTKQYVYYVTEGSQCKGKTGEDGKSYKIYFDALELVKEVSPIL
ncbi:outer membrane protein assembly factor BamE [Flammeovirga pectinis]|uniref:Outer membrane protein assembly factor BamE n=1 Tax=Flammeovirga pectinis TaxID=2494373 RepID=A0A3S9P448_9BACT|nr:outer membrane protein assembly factor BamE [Flammeovirga pectinis]AZQ62979.1 outer membrane protein assembly factor BamE [Flammeovirga pectinis]